MPRSEKPKSPFKCSECGRWLKYKHKLKWCEKCDEYFAHDGTRIERHGFVVSDGAEDVCKVCDHTTLHPIHEVRQ